MSLHDITKIKINNVLPKIIFFFLGEDKYLTIRKWCEQKCNPSKKNENSTDISE